MRIPAELRCPKHQRPFAEQAGARLEDLSRLICEAGCAFPVLSSIPRFVNSSDYASAFGLQWNQFRTTQLDSYTGTTIFRERLTRCLGGSLEVLRGKSVLEVGCGAGPFTEILLSAGARVFACDLSSAVEANYANCSGVPDYFVCQANVLTIPALFDSFDFVVCLGVIQHTPDPEQTIRALVKHVKPGGMLVIDHYSYNYPYPRSRRILRPLLLRLPPRLTTPLTLGMARALLPLHKFSRINVRGMWRLKSFLLKHSPLVDHFDDYPHLGEALVGEWSVLNTHDTLTDRYKHLRSAEEIDACLASCGLVDIEVSYGGNGVEARAKKSVASSAASAREKATI